MSDGGASVRRLKSLGASNPDYVIVENVNKKAGPILLHLDGHLDKAVEEVFGDGRGRHEMGIYLGQFAPDGSCEALMPE